MSYVHNKAPETIPFTHRILTSSYKGFITKGSTIQIGGAPHKVVTIRRIDIKGLEVIVTGKAQRIQEEQHATLNQTTTN